MGERQQAGIGEGGGPGRERQEEARRILERLEREHVGAEGIVRRGFSVRRSIFPLPVRLKTTQSNSGPPVSGAGLAFS